MARIRDSTSPSLTSISTHSRASNAEKREAQKRADAISRAERRRPPAARRAGALTIFFQDFFHHLDLEIPLREQFLEPRVLGLELLQPLRSARRQRSGCVTY